MKNTALIVIDLQNDITKNYKKIIGQVNEAIDWSVVSLYENELKRDPYGLWGLNQGERN